MNDLQFMPHQDEVLNLTDDKNRCAYYLDMGLGKTFVGAEKMYLLNNTVNLIVCQKSKIDDWVDHMKTYYPEYRVMDLTKKSEGVNFRTLVETKDLYDQNIQIVGVINYDLVFRRKYIAHITDFTLLLDESSLICNENAKRSKFILKLQPESVILLSGTPTAGKYERLWSQLKLLGWDINKKAFYASYVQTEWIENGDGYKKEVITGYKHVEHLKKRLTQFGAVFMKTEEVIELPEQTEQKIFLKITNEYKFFIKHNYLELDTRNLVRFKDDSDFEGEDVTPRVELIGDNSLTKTLYCRQLCGQWHKEKLEAFRDLLESTEDRLIVFYNFNEELTRLRKICESLNREVSFVNGSGRSMQKVQEAGNSRISETRKLTEIRSLDWSGEESYMLAKIAMAEAEGEGTEGKALVILVVLNRVWDEGFPDSIEEVISQDGQFTSYWDGRYDEAAPDEECWEAIRMIQVDKWDESQGATYFRSSSDESTWHSRNLQELFTHGNHTFYKEADE